MSKPIPVSMLKNPVHCLSLGLGSGLSKYAPGTMGTIVSIPPYLLIAQLDPMVYLAIVFIGFALGVYFCHYTSAALGEHDHSGIVWDEIIGFWITMMLVPEVSWFWVICGFLLFRFFDIVKPWPIGVADKQLTGGFGIMFDDVLAGLYAMAGLYGLAVILD